MDLIISEKTLKAAEISADELLIEIAVHLYDTERLSIGQAKNLVNMDHISFQQELAKRNIYIKYDENDLDTDLENLKAFHQKKAS
jgi:predicted HTH domain antitoxin